MASTPPIISLTAPTACGVVHRLPRSIVIPDDVLREINQYLRFKDAVTLSQLSKHVYEVVPPRLTHLVCTGASQLGHLRDYIHTGAGPSTATHASYLRSLRVSIKADISHTTTVAFVDVIKQAHNLEELVIGRSLSTAFSLANFQDDLPRLARLEFRGFDNTTLRTCPLPHTLHTLHLATDKPRRSGSALPLRRLLQRLSRLPSLRKLTFDDLLFGDDDDGDDDDDDGDEDSGEHDEDGDETQVNPDTDTSLPSIHTLELLNTDLPETTSMSQIFPSLSTLYVFDSLLPEEVSNEEDVTLKSLILRNIPDGIDLSWRTNRLTAIDIPEPTTIEDICERSSVSSLTLRVHEVRFSFWENLLPSIAQLRSLEIESFSTSLPELQQLFIELFLGEDANAELPQLCCLSILAPRYGPPYGEISAEHQALRTEFLEGAAKYLPSLRYVALASPGRIPRGLDDYSGDCVPWKWWRIVRDDEREPIEVREIPAWEGERVRRYMRDADADDAGNIEEGFVALR